MFSAVEGRKKNMKKKLIWRLDQRPTVEDLKTAVEADLISKEEAKEMLVRSEEDIPKDPLKEIKEEVKLLRELVLSRIGEKEVRIIERYYHDYWTTPSYPHYHWTNTYCTTANATNLTSGTLSLSSQTTGNNVTFTSKM